MLLRVTTVNRTKYFIIVVKIAKRKGFCVYRRSYLIGYPRYSTTKSTAIRAPSLRSSDFKPPRGCTLAPTMKRFAHK